MANSTDPLTALDAAMALAPIVGAGGVSGIVIAALGYLKAAREGRPASSLGTAGQVGIATLYAERAGLEAAARAFEALAHAVNGLRTAIAEEEGGKLEKLIDEVRDVRRAIEDLRPGK